MAKHCEEIIRRKADVAVLDTWTSEIGGVGLKMCKE